MRFVAFDNNGTATMGLVAGSDVTPLAPVHAFYDDLYHHLKLAASGSATPQPLSSLRLTPPVPATAKVLCVGLNYKAHAAEANRELPAAPSIFARWASTLACDGDQVPVPPGETGLDWEGELAVVVGARLRNATEEEAEQAIFAYSCFNDLSARTFQLAVPQWALGKNADKSGPIGPVLVTPDEITDPYQLTLVTRRNGEVMQDGTTSQMIFRAGQVLAYASQVMTLCPGDVLATGTPEGVGFLRTPPVLLEPGDDVEVEIEGIGTLRNTIADPAA